MREHINVKDRLLFYTAYFLFGTYLPYSRPEHYTNYRHVFSAQLNEDLFSHQVAQCGCVMPRWVETDPLRVPGAQNRRKKVVSSLR